MSNNAVVAFQSNSSICQPGSDPLPWWFPLTITLTVVVSTIGYKVASLLFHLIKRQLRYRRSAANFRRCQRVRANIRPSLQLASRPTLSNSVTYHHQQQVNNHQHAWSFGTWSGDWTRQATTAEYEQKSRQDGASNYYDLDDDDCEEEEEEEEDGNTVFFDDESDQDDNDNDSDDHIGELASYESCINQSFPVATTVRTVGRFLQVESPSPVTRRALAVVENGDTEVPHRKLATSINRFEVVQVAKSFEVVKLANQMSPNGKAIADKSVHRPSKSPFSSLDERREDELYWLTRSPKVVLWIQNLIDRLTASRRVRIYKLKLTKYCERLTSVSFYSGKIMLTIYIVLSTASWLIYILDHVSKPPISLTGIALDTWSILFAWINFFLNLFFLGFYLLKLFAATDPLLYIFGLSSLVDLCVIPMALFTVAQKCRFLDINFLRAICLFNYVDLLTFLGIIKSNSSIQTARISFALLSMWMVGSGLLHVIENLGDFWGPESSHTNWNYFETCYFLLVTLSTVGYGDLVSKSTLGRLFICIFIPVAMGVSVSFIPELFRNFSTYTVATDKYRTTNGRRHILICGHFDNQRLHTFIKGFISMGTSKHVLRYNLVILCLRPIDFALSAVLSKYRAWVHYFVGSPNNPQDLLRVRLREARAAVVLATPNTSRLDEEDGANIMQAISLKARRKSLRVVLQLHSFKNKCLINNFPRWTHLATDMVVCMEELKLGLMAYNCIAPGFATLILNLLNVHSDFKLGGKFEAWRTEYESSFKMGLYDVGISREFDNLFVKDLAILMYKKWNLVLLAICCLDTHEPSIRLNPIEANFKVNVNIMRAVVVAPAYTEAMKLQSFCKLCLAHVMGQVCHCQKPPSSKRFRRTQERELALYEQLGQSRRSEDLLSIQGRMTHPTSQRSSLTMTTVMGRSGRKLVQRMFASSLPFPIVDKTAVGRKKTEVRKHLAPIDLAQRRPRNVDRPNQQQKRRSFSTNLGSNINTNKRNESQSPEGRPCGGGRLFDRTGSFHWVPDIDLSRATLSTKQATEFKFCQHYLICVVGTPLTNCLNLENFVMPLRFHWRPVQDIVILGNSQLIGQHQWVKLKNLPRVYIVHGDPCSFNDLYAVQLSQCSSCVILGDAGDSAMEEACEQDRRNLFCAMNIRSLLQREKQMIHQTTELRYEENARLFSSIETGEYDHKLPVWFSEPFACGFIFSNSLLYGCLSSLFYNDHVFRFLRVLISGQATYELEASFAVGSDIFMLLPIPPTRLLYKSHTPPPGLQQNHKENPDLVNGINVSLRSMTQPPFCYIQRKNSKKPHTFNDIFMHCMQIWNVLCLGIYRLEDRGFRYVLVNPDPEMPIYMHDMIYCFVPTSQTETSWICSSGYLKLVKSSGSL